MRRTSDTDEEGRAVVVATSSLRPAANNIIDELPSQNDLRPATPLKSPFEAVEAAISKFLQPEVSTGGLEPGSSLIDPIRVPELDSASSQEIRFTRHDELRAICSSPNAITWRRGIAGGALVAVFGLGWAAGWNTNAFLGLAPASAPIEHTSDCRRQSGKETLCLSSKSDRSTSSAAANIPEIAAPIRGLARGAEPSWAAAQSAGLSASGESLLNQQNASSTAVAVATQERRKNSPTLRPVPETKPTTIEGWRVREVDGGKVILEGPNGIFNATPGDTVPGVGRVDSIVRWGNRLIVATTRGLISTEN